MDLRSRHLGNLAHLCNCPPPVVDELRMTDFAQLILYIEASLKSQENS